MKKKMGIVALLVLSVGSVMATERSEEVGEKYSVLMPGNTIASEKIEISLDGPTDGELSAQKIMERLEQHLGGECVMKTNVVNGVTNFSAEIRTVDRNPKGPGKMMEFVQGLTNSIPGSTMRTVSQTSEEQEFIYTIGPDGKMTRVEIGEGESMEELIKRMIEDGEGTAGVGPITFSGSGNGLSTAMLQQQILELKGELADQKVLLEKILEEVRKD